MLYHSKYLVHIVAAINGDSGLSMFLGFEQYGSQCQISSEYTTGLSYCCVVQSLSHDQLFVTPQTAACQASLSFTISLSLLTLMFIELVMLTISFSATLFFCLQSFPVSGSFPVSWLFASGGQSTGASALTSVLPMNIHGGFPLGLTGLISLQSKGLSRVFSTIQRYQFFSAQPSLWSKPNIYTGLLAENTHYPDNSLRWCLSGQPFLPYYSS